MHRSFTDYYRCPEQPFEVGEGLSDLEGFFTFRETICYGRRSRGRPSQYLGGSLPDLSHYAQVRDGRLCLPFNLDEVATNLRQERYRAEPSMSTAWRNIYYSCRPLLPVVIRRHLQKVYLNGWENIPFPRWPVDLSVDNLMKSVMTISLTYGREKEIPFIWFWPGAARGCVINTHDVEAKAGRDFCEQVMDVDESYDLKSAFQLVPEQRYSVTPELLQGFRRRGFEVNVHDLNHDGQLFDAPHLFQKKAARINAYVREFGSSGFRSGAMYREQGWYDAFEFSYDMSVPNVAHLEPQRGGCCTVMPYFIGKTLELPLTTAQDYTLFHILGDYSIELWKRQIDLILSANGLVSLLTHPDYLIDEHTLSVYRELLAYLSQQLRSRRKLWFALPSEVDSWWRSRSQMTLVRDGQSWRVNGADADRARIAYATLKDGELSYRVEGCS